MDCPLSKPPFPLPKHVIGFGVPGLILVWGKSGALKFLEIGNRHRVSGWSYNKIIIPKPIE